LTPPLLNPPGTSLTYLEVAALPHGADIALLPAQALRHLPRQPATRRATRDEEPGDQEPSQLTDVSTLLFCTTSHKHACKYLHSVKIFLSVPVVINSTQRSPSQSSFFQIPSFRFPSNNVRG
jgi:hypothetical protein